MSEREVVREWWMRASRDLGFRASVPWSPPGEGASIEFDAFLPDFGGSKGIAVCSVHEITGTEEVKAERRMADRLGLFSSFMRVSPDYTPAEFCEALVDWGYFGPPNRRPFWMPTVTLPARPGDRRVHLDREISIVNAQGDPWVAMARQLIVEYGDSIASVAACSLEHQRFGDEVRSLPGIYGPPRGHLLLALAGGTPSGCIALRPLDALGPHVCEMKRLYIHPAYRGLGLGRLLVNRLLEDARAIGYTLMKLDTDTHEKFAAAIALYRSLGFTQCPRYNADPDPKTLWFERRL